MWILIVEKMDQNLLATTTTYGPYESMVQCEQAWYEFGQDSHEPGMFSCTIEPTLPPSALIARGLNK
jgi:hypothetical protein